MLRAEKELLGWVILNFLLKNQELPTPNPNFQPPRAAFLKSVWFQNQTSCGNCLIAFLKKKKQMPADKTSAIGKAIQTPVRL